MGAFWSCSKLIKIILVLHLVIAFIQLFFSNALVAKCWTRDFKGSHQRKTHKDVPDLEKICIGYVPLGEYNNALYNELSLAV